MRLLATLLAFAVASPLAAQSLPDWAEPSAPSAPAAVESELGPGPPPPPPPPPPVPVDGGLGLLALAGAGYAAHKLRRRQAE
ncbi:MAG: hypothetical protein AAGI52_18770 [Bacteroidota bacterium]